MVSGSTSLLRSNNNILMRKESALFTFPEKTCMLNVNNADYVDYVLGKVHTCILVVFKMAEDVTWGEELLNKLCYFYFL